MTKLTQREVDAADTLFSLARKLSRLSPDSLEKVFDRWDMLHMMDDEEQGLFRKWLNRVTQELRLQR